MSVAIAVVTFGTWLAQVWSRRRWSWQPWLRRSRLRWDTVLTDDLELFLALAADPRSATTFYAGGGSGVFKTVNGGSAWRTMSRGLLDDVTAEEFKHRLLEGFVTALAVNPRHPQTLYLGSDRGVFKSTDGAISWRAVNTGLIRGRSKYKLIGSLALDPRNPQNVYAAVVWAPTGAGLFKSTNGGRSWRSSALPDKGYVSALALDQQNPRTIYAGTRTEGGGHAFKSTDAGRTWHALTFPDL